MENLRWWGYKHTNGSLQVKRYFSEQDIDEATESPFVESIVYPFDAENRDEALQYIINEFNNPPTFKSK